MWEGDCVKLSYEYLHLHVCACVSVESYGIACPWKAMSNICSLISLRMLMASGPSTAWKELEVERKTKDKKSADAEACLTSNSCSAATVLWVSFGARVPLADAD